MLEQCNFKNTNIECYQPSTCKKFDNSDSEIENENQNMGIDLKYCTEAEIKSVKKKVLIILKVQIIIVLV